MRGDGLDAFPMDEATPDDVRLLHGILSSLPERGRGDSTVTIDCRNCGTAMRFLTAFFAARPGCRVVLDGVERMRHRPVGQLVDALRALGADITCLGTPGFPPLLIRGRRLDLSRPVTILRPASTQFVSALLLIGAQVHTDSTSPYIALTRSLLRTSYIAPSYMERDWSSAAFWYEYAAIHGGSFFFPSLTLDSLQPDRVAADLFARLGVRTTATPDGIRIHAPRPGADTERDRPTVDACPARTVPDGSPTDLRRITVPLRIDFSH